MFIRGLILAGFLGVIWTPACGQTAVTESAQAVPEIMSQILLAYPKARLLLSSAPACEIGENKTESFGMLIQTDVLQALVVYKGATGWEIAEVPREIRNSKGSDENFLGDFRNQAGDFAGPFEIRCASPGRDTDITPRASGEFAGKGSPEVKHLCFQASKSYNSWHCLSINPATGRPETSFVQMAAD